MFCSYLSLPSKLYTPKSLCAWDTLTGLILSPAWFDEGTRIAGEGLGRPLELKMSSGSPSRQCTPLVMKVASFFFVCGQDASLIEAVSVFMSHLVELIIEFG
jgi:hypothetical protein